MSAVAYGIGVSHRCGDVKWPLVATQCRFAITAATAGTDYKDPSFARNYKAIHDAGLIRGSVHLAQPRARLVWRETAIIKDAEAEADWYLETIGTDRRRTLPCILNLEWSRCSRGVQTEAMIEWALAWLDRVESQTMMIPIVLTGRGFWRYKLGSTNALMRHSLWLTQRKKNAQGFGPKHRIGAWDWLFWQYSRKRVVPGVPEPCDANIFSSSGRRLEQFVAEAPYDQRPFLPQYHHADPIFLDRFVCWTVESFFS